MTSNFERRVEKLEQAGDSENHGGIVFIVGTDKAEVEARAAANPNRRPDALTFLVVRSRPPRGDASPA